MHAAHVGCSGWNYSSWRPLVYPQGLATRDWLLRYAQLFHTVEVNSTFYRLAKRDAVARCVAQTPKGFVFAVKASRYLTHIKRLTDMEDGIARFYERIEPLIDAGRIGPMLWQLPETFHRDDERLAAALERLPRGRHAFELRHASWFTGEVYALLRRHRAALVLGDHPQRPFQTDEPTVVGLRAPALRRSRPAWQLLRARARGVGSTVAPVARRARPVRVPQQRLGGLRAVQRAVAQQAAGRARAGRENVTAGERVSLAQLRERAAGCRDRELWRGATQTVFGEGPATARLMLVGEQPGDREDREGRPFVCLGLTAGHALLGSKLSIGRDRGRLLETELAPAALLTAHPSSVLRERDSDARHAAHAALVRDLRIASAAC